MQENSMLEKIFEEQFLNAFDKNVKNDDEYRKSLEMQKEALKNLSELNLSRNEMLVVDRVLSANNLNGAAYGRAAYRQGFQDALKLISELKQCL